MRVLFIPLLLLLSADCCGQKKTTSENGEERTPLKGGYQLRFLTDDTALHFVLYKDRMIRELG